MQMNKLLLSSYWSKVIKEWTVLDTKPVHITRWILATEVGKYLWSKITHNFHPEDCLLRLKKSISFVKMRDVSFTAEYFMLYFLHFYLSWLHLYLVYENPLHVMWHQEKDWDYQLAYLAPKKSSIHVLLGSHFSLDPVK